MHEAGQFLLLTHHANSPSSVGLCEPFGDFWSATVPIAGTAAAVPGSALRTGGRYVYR